MFQKAVIDTADAIDRIGALVLKGEKRTVQANTAGL
jgi:hypothetical protein